MNTRGLMEMVVLNIGRDIGVVSPSLFTMCIIMALVTTAMTTPLLDMLVKRTASDELPAAIASPEPTGS
jgi:Kef-type K+ transport system membrane component KefB